MKIPVVGGRQDGAVIDTKTMKFIPEMPPSGAPVKTTYVPTGTPRGTRYVPEVVELEEGASAFSTVFCTASDGWPWW